MTSYPIADYDDAYANLAHIPAAETFPPRWTVEAAAFRARLATEGRARLDMRYGDRPRNLLDLFLPERAPKGLAVYVHGGYWMARDKADWSHLAQGALARGFAVAMPSYTLCPDIGISGIAREIASAVAVAAFEVAGPIRLAGHSAGGHLVTRLVSGTPILDADLLDRIAGVVSISGVHDLRPILKTSMNKTLGLDAAEAEAESPALLAPLVPIPVTAYVGAAERPEFIRQTRLLYEMWRGFAPTMAIVEAEGLHHFTVIDGLIDPESRLCGAFVGPAD